MNTSTGNSRQMARSPEDVIFGAADKVEHLREKVDLLRGEVLALRDVVFMLATGAMTASAALSAIGAGSERADLIPELAPTPAQALEAKLATLDRLRYATRPVSDYAPPTGSVVYYIDRGGLVKIGTTSRFAKRMATMYVQPREVLAVEAGGYARESERHQQFSHLRTAPRSELFRVADDLRDHMLALRTENPDPWAFGTETAA